MKDRILVKREEAPDQPIILTDADKWKICKVLAVGPGKWIDGEFVRTSVKPGDLILVPGIASEHPDHEFDDGSFLIQQADIGGLITYA